MKTKQTKHAAGEGVHASWSTPLGVFEAEVGERGVRSLDIKKGGKIGAPAKGAVKRIESINKKSAPGAINAATKRNLAALEKYLKDYFAGRKPAVLPQLDETGRTDFEKRIWAAARGIDHGSTLNYGALAAVLGAPKSARAAGGALGRNPLLLLTPCHRIVPASAKAPWDQVGGFASGPAAKQWMLRFEMVR